MVMVRDAAVEDADAVGRVHVRGWQAGYRGLMPDAYLDGLRTGECAETWRRRLGAPRERRVVLVAECERSVVGLADGGPARELSGPGVERGDLGTLVLPPRDA
ncbi:MAG: hypothetical protein ACRDN9_17980 [Streptosporangiaceae bacterium]